MNLTLGEFFINGFFICLAISLFLTLDRLKKGPSLADRVVAIDLFFAIILSAVAIAAIYADEPTYFDIAIILSLFGFLGTSIFARFIYNQEKK